MAENDVAGSSNTQPLGGAPQPQAAQPQSQPPQGAAVPVGHTPLQDDIGRILKNIQLPERRGVEPEAPQKKYDTSLPGTEGHTPEAVPANPAPSSDAGGKPSIAEIALGVHQPISDVRSVHTLKDDLQHVVKEKKISLVRATALEEEKRHRVTSTELAQAVAAKPRKFGIAVFVSLTLMTLGILALSAVYVVMQRQKNPANSILQTNSLVFAEQSISLPIGDLMPNDLRRELGTLRQTAALTLGAILHVLPLKDYTDINTNYTEPKPVPFAEFMQSLGANPPQELLRALDSQFFFGVHTVDENAPVFVVPVISYERAFAAMLQWEKTMNADLTPVFTAVPRQTLGPDGVPVERVFEDAVMRNYDVRQLKDDQGVVQLYYSFPTRNILIIAESPYTFTEVLSRLRADRRL